MFAKKRMAGVVKILPGIILCFIIASISFFIAGHFGVPVMLVCLLLGMAFHFLSYNNYIKSGVGFTSRTLLRFGVVLIGARIMFSDFMALGEVMIFFIVLVTIFVIFMGVVWARFLGLSRDQGVLIGGATAICGASAALAISAIMPNSKHHERNTLIAIIGVTIMGTIAMIAAPFLIKSLDLNDVQAGILIGGAIHDVAQVVGAGYSVSDETGDTAILVKMIRVFLLVPVLFALAFIYGARAKKREKVNKWSFFPVFLIGFMVMAGVNSFNIIPAGVTGVLSETSKWFLILAITAVGIKTSLATVFSLGWRPFILVVAETATITALYIFIICF